MLFFLLLTNCCAYAAEKGTADEAVAPVKKAVAYLSANGKEFIKTANSKTGKGWVDYKWPNPLSKALEAKSSYVEKAGEVIIGCGIYK